MWLPVSFARRVYFIWACESNFLEWAETQQIIKSGQVHNAAGNFNFHVRLKNADSPKPMPGRMLLNPVVTVQLTFSEQKSLDKKQEKEILVNLIKGFPGCRA